MPEPKITYHPKKRIYVIHDGSNKAPMNTEGNMIELKPNTAEQRKLIKALMRKIN